MVLAIAWRNPHLVRNTKRCIRLGRDTLSAVYLVQERIAADEGQWVNTSVLEAFVRRDVKAPISPDHATNASRAVGTKVTSQQQ